MAITKLQAPLAGLRGTVGGVVYSANATGTYAKSWKYPKNARNVLQSEKRDWFARVRSDWLTLNPGQIAIWNALAFTPPEIDYNSLGVSIKLSGSAWHTRINMRRLQAGQAIESDCPVNASLAPPITFGLVCYDFTDGASDDLFTYTNGDFTGYYAYLELALTLSPVRNKQTTGYRVTWCGTVDAVTQTRINEELATAFGWINQGQKLFGRLRKQGTNGIRSTAIDATTVVLPAA